MWVANVDVRLGDWLVGVRADSDANRARLERLLGAYLDRSGTPTRTNFSVRAPSRRRFRRSSTTGDGDDPTGLYVAGDRVLTTDRFDEIAHRLAGHLAGVAAVGDAHGHRPGAGRVVVEGARVVVRGDRAVVVAAQCAGPIDDPDTGTTELSVWQPVVDAATGAVVVPQPLDGLDWRAAKLDPPPALPDGVRLVGVVAPPMGEDRANLPALWLAATGDLDAWGARLSLLDEEDRVVCAAAHEVRAAAASLLAADAEG